ncbi:hypothetical protein GOP47_0018137 [Adiantum capillus-veneris]|uniref:Uncharacterized protein n=1 Tax=Adiantum capillus-veneris TaxID=13818 RepID=A0A9D4UGR3_ADICA|nr:hypothetical protein GOP47_0018137 [Adiantum capillus-veneris]
MSKGNTGPPSPPPGLEVVNPPASSLASDKSINSSSRSRSRSKRRMREEIVAIPSNASSLPAAENPESPHDHPELEELFYGKGKGSSNRIHGPISLIYNIFTCWSRDRTKSGSFQHISGRPRLNSFAAAALLEQNRLQQEALVESQDTRDMWEWQMEQQRLITCQEHDLLERNQLEVNPLLGHVLPELVHTGGQLMRNASARSDVGSKDAHTETKSKASPSSSEVSPPSDVNPQLGPTWHEPDLISAMVLLFEAALLRCRSEINFFCRIYLQQMVFSGYTLIRTLMEMEPNTVFLKKVHASYALESRINNALFRCFENDSFDDSGLTQIFDPAARAVVRLQDYVRMKSVDPEDALGVHNASYDPCFHSFCATKSEEVMAMFSWNMGYRSAAERDRFMEAFLRAAKWVWLLHRLANATNPPMQIIRVGRGQEVDPMYLEPVAVPPIGSCQSCSAASIPKVEFMVMPGFIAYRKVFRCRIYQHYICK